MPGGCRAGEHDHDHGEQPEDVGPGPRRGVGRHAVHDQCADAAGADAASGAGRSCAAAVHDHLPRGRDSRPGDHGERERADAASASSAGRVGRDAVSVYRLERSRALDGVGVRGRDLLSSAVHS